jgi:hypothetical protein
LRFGADVRRFSLIAFGKSLLGFARVDAITRRVDVGRGSPPSILSGHRWSAARWYVARL